MTDADLERLYGELCRALSEAGPERGMLLLARFALLAMQRIDDPAALSELLGQAIAAARHDG